MSKDFTAVVVQAGAVGIAFALIWHVGRKLDHVAETLSNLTGQIRELILIVKDRFRVVVLLALMSAALLAGCPGAVTRVRCSYVPPIGVS